MGRVARIRLIPGLPGRARAWRYGPHRSQRAELLLPQGAGPHRVMVVIHGGGWRDRATMSQTGALAEDLTRRGWATWNIEYRRVGEGGGWPATFEDVAGAIDRLAGLDAPLDLDAVSVLGHSAGGHLALWAAGRERLPAGSPGASPVVPLRRAIGMAAVCDLAGAYRRWRGGAVEGLMGGAPEQLPERYAVADPLAQVPLHVPVLLVHGALDKVVPIELARRYARAATDAGGTVALVEIDGEGGRHLKHLHPRGAPWAAVTRWLAEQAAAGEA